MARVGIWNVRWSDTKPIAPAQFREYNIGYPVRWTKRTKDAG